VDMNKLQELGSNEKFCRYKGLLVQCGPWGMTGESDFLFRNRGDGTFEDVSKRAGVDDPNHYYGLGVVIGDYDNDGWPDIYVANDAGPNYLYHNRHDGTFEETGLSGGADLSGEGLEQGSMGVDMGDYENNGQQGIIVTNFVDQSDTLYRNMGKQGFADASWNARIAQSSRPYVGWGTSFFDMDNDGWLDLLVVNGHVYPQVDSIAGEVRYKQAMLLFRNKHDGTFEEIAAGAGLADMPLQSRRGAAFGDVNNDGCVDVVVVNAGALPSLLLNHCDPRNHRVMFRLTGAITGKLAIGARVTLKSNGLTQMREVRSGASYLSQNDLRVHFGLGDEPIISAVEILWPSGQKETLKNVAADFIYDVREGGGIQSKTPLPPVTK